MQFSYLYGNNFDIELRTTDVWIPIAFCVINLSVITVAVIRVWIILRAEQTFTLNEKYMAIYVGTLILCGAASLLSHYLTVKRRINLLWLWTIYSTLNFIVGLLMAFILWQVSDKKKKCNLIIEEKEDVDV